MDEIEVSIPKTAPNDPGPGNPAAKIIAPETGKLEIERRVRIVGLSAEDAAHIAAFRDVVLNDVARMTTGFFDTLRRLDGSSSLFNDQVAMTEAIRLKSQHLTAMISGDYGPEYFEQCVQLGTFYSKGGFDVVVFLRALHELVEHIGTVIARHAAADPKDGAMAIAALQKLTFLEIGIVVDAWISERERVINFQQEAIRELSTPVLQVRNQLLILPLIGMIDSHRAMQITDSLLRSIRANRARVVVIDITGVAAVDTKVANHLLQAIAASQLMGTKVIVTGLSADVAQSLVGLGIDLSTVNSVGDLQGGLEEAERLLGYRTVRASDAPEVRDRPRED
jgi:rsbT co-antagonist protein RsbR